MTVVMQSNATKMSSNSEEKEEEGKIILDNDNDNDNSDGTVPSSSMMKNNDVMESLNNSRDDEGEEENTVCGNNRNNNDDNKDKDDGKSKDTVSAMTVYHLVYIIPFFVKLSSTLPPLYLAVALQDQFGVSGVTQGIVIASFQFARAAVIGITMYSPVISIVFGSLFGTLGFVCLAFYPMWKDESYALVLFSVSNVFIGLTNAFSALQIFAKQEYSNDMVGLRFALRRQSVISGVACVLSYFLSGIMYDKLGLVSIGILGCVMMAMALVSLIMYLLGRRQRVIEEVVDTPRPDMIHWESFNKKKSASCWQSLKSGLVDVIVESHGRRSTEASFFASWVTEDLLGCPSLNSELVSRAQEDVDRQCTDEMLATIEEQAEELQQYLSEDFSLNDDESASMRKSTTRMPTIDEPSSEAGLGLRLTQAVNSGRFQLEEREKILSEFSTAEEVALNNVVFVIAAAFLIEAITSGSLFAIGPLYIEMLFEKSTTYTGIIFGLSSVFGTTFTFLVISDKGRKAVRKIFPNPINIYVIMLTISIATLFLTIPLFPVQIICIALIIGFNEALWALLTEMTGAITTEKYYLTIGPGALLVHKIVNMIMSLVTPMLLQVTVWLPYTFAGIIALTFSIFFVVKIEMHRRLNAKLVAETVNNKRMTMVQMKAMCMSFTTLETLSRMASVKAMRDKKKKKNMFKRMSTQMFKKK
eukprot:CAMPEP_0170815226 /NCGR_PEP_ID=MMETSP0733-20121128/38304_1 /TAXON_ID=186038 /ORGANISM="Fragilariopsis kerguelensis, Strain L26-C5" /LENGTH=698 /DNA_ID=CAMNT_0011173687 /DNA_START=21 /DNA_END=2117 /DNA_ORIENTATION=-